MVLDMVVELGCLWGTWFKCWWPSFY